MASRRTLHVATALAAALLALAADAARVSDVRNTRHNLSASAGAANTVRATTETQVCVFCHTPHFATPGATPLWNRKLSGATYTPYTSSSLDANAIQGALDQPGGSSKLCLSCHDGTLAIGNVNVLNQQGSATEQATVSITMQGTGAGGTMPAGSGTTTGYTRNLGIDLTNDHPISLNFTSALATRDGELRAVDSNQKWPPGTGTVVGVRSPAYRPQMPLEPTGAGGVGQVQCATCHDPHLRETDTSKGNQKFLRTNRFQEGTPVASHNEATDIICLSCHDKNQASGIWAFSAHANPQVATQTYTTAAAQLRHFPDAVNNGQNLPVWKAACLNCHDTHTAQGARRLLRDGTDSVAVPKAGGNAAQEEVCYACHTTAAASALASTTTVPDVRSEFQLARRMPITNLDQAVASEPHDIDANFTDPGYIDCSGPANRCGADFIEPRGKLGAGNLGNRHAECTDCHNPHRVVKFRDFRGNPAGTLGGAPDPAGTHRHTDTTGYTHSNLLSGVLRGTWGVEPVYVSPSFQTMPGSFIVKRGDPGSSIDTSVNAAYVTREYQICLKCHSNYGYDDNNTYPIGNRPDLAAPGTPSGTNNLAQYTNQAKEFQAPSSHQGEVQRTNSGASPEYNTVNDRNHRSWHPVLDSTGRTGTIRGGGSADISARWRLPWSNAVGAQTMYCSDCHGGNVSAGTSVIPNGGENGRPWGPHGSENNFLLKGLWNTSTGTGQAGTGLCFKCHNYDNYTGNSEARTGFWIVSGPSSDKDGHKVHRDKIGGNRMMCNWCHAAVPHGWKNKALLVNLNDVGPEVGQPVGTEVRKNTTTPYNQGPYYMNAMLKVREFRPSGQWVDTACGCAEGRTAAMAGPVVTGCAKAAKRAPIRRESAMSAVANSHPIPARTSLLRRLASLRLTLVLIAWLALAVVYAYRLTGAASWSVALPLAALALNLIAAVASHPAFRRQTALLVFHLALIALVLLLAVGRLIEMRGRIEVTQGARFDGQLIESAAGPLHPWHLERAAFFNDGFEIDYAAGYKRGPTRNRVRWRDDGVERRAQIGDHTPLVLAAYRIYTSPNKGFAVRLRWQREHVQIAAALHFPAYPVFQYGQTVEWNLPDSRIVLKLKLDLPDKLIDPDGPSHFALPSHYRLLVDDGSGERELAPQTALAIAGSTLLHEGITTWMGYSVIYDPTTPWLLACCAVAIAALAWHFRRRFAARPWTPD